MSAVWAAFWIGIGAPTVLYVTKRAVDILFPPDTHIDWCFSRFLRPNDEHHDDDPPEHY